MDEPPHSALWIRRGRWATAILFLLGVAAIFLVPADWLIGWAQGDLGQQFLAWRALAAASLRAGHLPGWNPSVYSGEPFLAGFQSAVFYPPNLIFLLLPLCRAINLSLLIHLFVLGTGMARWARQRGLHPFAAAVAGFVLPLSGPVFPHLYAGHLSNICTLAWAPWMLAGLEQWYARGERRGWLLASAAIALQILAGQVQYVFYLAVAALVHGGARALAAPAAARRVLSGLAAAYLLGAGLAAAQLVPGLAAAGESVRQHGLDRQFVGSFSFPPENLLTAVAPGFFGDPVRNFYWGRSSPWEMSLFVGVAGIFLLASVTADPVSRRSVRSDLGIAALLLLLACGRHTPLFRWLYDYGPGFDRFRGWSKFTFPAGLFVVLAIGHGVDALWRRRPPARAVALIGGALGAVALAIGLALAMRPSLLGPVFRHLRRIREDYVTLPALSAPELILSAGRQAGWSLAVAGTVALLCGAAFARARTRPRGALLVPALLVIEMLAFAATQFDDFSLSDAVDPDIRAVLAAHPGDYRIQNRLASDNGFLLGASDIWGDDPAVLRRYAEWIAFTQGADPDRATQIVTFGATPPLYRLLRLRYVFSPAPTGGLKIEEVESPLAPVQLISAYRVLPDRNAIFAALNQPGFDPGQTVLLEREPDPRPQPGDAPGRVQVVNRSADALVIEAEVRSPSLLLITDAYSRDWHARPLPGSSQANYDVLPADSIVRAVPLAAGHHRILMDYEVRGLSLGLGLSALSALVWAGLRFRRPKPAEI